MMRLYNNVRFKGHIGIYIFFDWKFFVKSAFPFKNEFKRFEIYEERKGNWKRERDFGVGIFLVVRKKNFFFKLRKLSTRALVQIKYGLSFKERKKKREAILN